MIEKTLREIYPIDTISQDKSWQKIYECLKDTTEEIKIRFQDNTIVDPWRMEYFQKLVRLPNLHFAFINSEQLVNRLKIMFIMEDLDVSRIENIEVAVPHVKTPEELRLEKLGTNVFNNFKVDNGCASLDLENMYSQLGSPNTFDYVKFAVDKMIDEQGIKEFYLNIGGISAVNRVLELFAEMQIDYKRNGVNIDINITDEENLKNFGLFSHQIRNARYTPELRAKYIIKFLKKHVNMPGMLIQYKKSRALDEFGRQGKGEKIMSRIAIIRGISGGTVRIETFNNNYFYTHQHWMVTHDNQVPTELKTDIKDVKIDELGFCNEFLGSRFHFMEAIQRDKAESTKVIYSITDDGTNLSKLCTIPERMKIVFDDWGIQYDKDMLDRAIKLSNESVNSDE